MLKGISPALSPDLLKLLCEMGHGDEIVLADANFPGASVAKHLTRADGLPVATMLDAVLPLFPLDSYADPLIMMQVVAGDRLDPAVEADYMQVVRRHQADAPAPSRIERNAFYERASHAFCVVMTGEARIYGNIILKKGVIA
jgi:L-fucose mutarotase